MDLDIFGYVLSIIGCIALILWLFYTWNRYGDPYDIHIKGKRFPVELIVGIAGFSVFPVINTAMLIAFGLWYIL